MLNRPTNVHNPFPASRASATCLAANCTPAWGLALRACSLAPISHKTAKFPSKIMPNFSQNSHFPGNRAFSVKPSTATSLSSSHFLMPPKHHGIVEQTAASRTSLCKHASRKASLTFFSDCSSHATCSSSSLLCSSTTSKLCDLVAAFAHSFA